VVTQHAGGQQPLHQTAYLAGGEQVGEEQVYAGTTWTTVRMQIVHDPGHDYAHLPH
jgi:hypothetical protein